MKKKELKKKIIELEKKINYCMLSIDSLRDDMYSIVDTLYPDRFDGDNMHTGDLLEEIQERLSKLESLWFTGVEQQNCRVTGVEQQDL